MIIIIGLKYTCIINNIKFKEIGEELGVSKQTVNSWISGSRKIPDKYLEILSSKFNLQKEYFEKEIDESDKMKIQNAMLGQQIKFVDVDCVDDDGNKYVRRIEDPYNSKEYIMLNKIKIEGIDTLKKVRLHMLGNDKELEKNMGEEIEKMKECIRIYNDIATIIDSPNIENKSLRNAIDFIFKIYNIKIESKVDDTNWAF